MPIYPLDGGQIARELLLAARGRQGMRQSLLLSLWTAGALAVFGWPKATTSRRYSSAQLAAQSYLLLQADGGAAEPW